MSVVLQVSVGGGPYSTGRVSAAEGESIQLTAASFAGWRTPVARWSIYSFPPAFGAPAGWSTDPSGFYYWDGNSDPPAFTVTHWGKYQLRLAATDGDERHTDTSTGIVVPSAIGLTGGVTADETSAFGGDREQWTYDLKRDIHTIDSLLGGSGVVTFESLTLSQASETLVMDLAGAEWSLLSSNGLELSADNLQLNVGSAGTITLSEAGITVATITPDNGGGGSGLLINVAQQAGGFVVQQAQKTSAGTGGSIILTAQQAQAGSAGGAVVISSGRGGTPGTNNAGSIRLDVRDVVANVSQSLELHAGATQVLNVRQSASTVTEIAAGAAGGAGAQGLLFKGNFVNAEPTTHVALQAPTIYLTTSSALMKRISVTAGEERIADIGGADIYKRTFIRAFGPITSATTTSIATFATTSNRVYKVMAEVTLSNDTDNEAKSFESIATFKNVAGVLSISGSVTADHAQGDAGQAGITFTLDASGTDIRARLTTDSGDTVNGRCIIHICETVLT